MNHDQQRPDAQEQQLLAHFREHAGGEPSAELDALILGAARAELTKEPSRPLKNVGEAGKTRQKRPKKRSLPTVNEHFEDVFNAGLPTQVVFQRPVRPGLVQRLHNWLFGAGRQRWSLALAGLACVGVGVSLTWRTLERTPPVFDAPGEVLMAPAMRSAAPAAPMADAMPAPQARERQGLSEAPAKKALEAEVAVEALSTYEDLAVGAAAAAPPAELARKTEEAEFARQLQRLSKLRRDGWQEEADQLLLQLMRDYPQRNIELELRALELQAQ